MERLISMCRMYIIFRYDKYYSIGKYENINEQVVEVVRCY
jgi:hypothetical protein